MRCAVLRVRSAGEASASEVAHAYADVSIAHHSGQRVAAVPPNEPDVPLGAIYQHCDTNTIHYADPERGSVSFKGQETEVMRCHRRGEKYVLLHGWPAHLYPVCSTCSARERGAARAASHVSPTLEATDA